MSILNTIITAKKQQIKKARLLITEQQLEIKAAEQNTKTRGFYQALAKKSNNKQTAIIAEIKKASPSKGLLCKQFSPRNIAKDYEKNGACCLSVLTDTEFFQGKITDLEESRAAVNIPVLRKDFIIDTYQIYESKACGADAILLIASVLDDYQLAELYKIASACKLDVLCEVHTEIDIERVLTHTNTKLVGINNRNLDTFKVDINHTKNLQKMLPDDVLLVAESGIVTHEQILELQQFDIYAFLIGSHLMQHKNPGTALNKLLNN